MKKYSKEDLDKLLCGGIIFVNPQNELERISGSYKYMNNEEKEKATERVNLELNKKKG